MPSCGELLVGVSGASPDTGNLGVSALFHAICHELQLRVPSITFNVLSYTTTAGDVLSGQYRIRMIDVVPSRNWLDPRHIERIIWEARAGVPLSSRHRHLRRTDAFLDISGGDSFTDLYGRQRFRGTIARKRLALALGKPLLLLPQTYGPFRSPASRAVAARICRQVRAAWARDERSFQVLRDLLGDDFDSERHQCGVDVAFLLPTREPNVPLGDRLQTWLETRSESEPLLGLNVSGLLYNDPERAKSRYGFLADYQELVRELVLRLTRDGARVVLTPHVVTPPGHYESDTEASERLTAALPAEAVTRVAVAPAFSDPREVKWLIGKYDWFCGTRMHSAIAGLSQAVPTAAISYSIKTAGVFETCGQGACVADPRAATTDQVLEHLLSCFGTRQTAAASLGELLPHVVAIARAQMDAICSQLVHPTASSSAA